MQEINYQKLLISNEYAAVLCQQYYGIEGHAELQTGEVIAKKRTDQQEIRKRVDEAKNQSEEASEK